MPVQVYRGFLDEYQPVVGISTSRFAPINLQAFGQTPSKNDCGMGLLKREGHDLALWAAQQRMALPIADAAVGELPSKSLAPMESTIFGVALLSPPA